MHFGSVLHETKSTFQLPVEPTAWEPDANAERTGESDLSEEHEGGLAMADGDAAEPIARKPAPALARTRSQLQSLPYPDRFFAAAAYAGLGDQQPRTGSPPAFKEDTRLLLYSLYQQATLGPCKDPKPKVWNLLEQAKWTSWQHLRETSSVEAMRLFVRTLEEEDADWYLKAEQQLLGPSDLGRQLELPRSLVSDSFSSSATQQQRRLEKESEGFSDGPVLVGSRSGARIAGQGVDQAEPGSGQHAEAVANGSGFFTGSPRKSRYKSGVVADIQALAVLNDWIAVPVSSYRPPGRYQHAAAVVDDKLFVVGGNHSGRFLNDVQVLDLNNLKWTKLDNKRSTASLSSLADAQDWLPPCAGHSLVRDGGRLLSVAGHSKSTSETVLVHSFDLFTQSWSLLRAYGSAPSPRGGQSVTRVDSTLVMFGGEDSKRRLLNDVCILDLETMTWDMTDTLGTPPSPRSGHTAALWADRYLLVFGGSSHSRCFNDLHVLDLQTLEWSEAQTPGFVPTARAGHAGLVVGENWYIIGGGDNKCGIPETVVLNMATLVWSLESKVEPASSLASEGLSVVAVSEGDAVFLVAFGGYNGRFSNDVHVLKTIQPARVKPKLIKSPSAAAAAASAASAAKNFTSELPVFTDPVPAPKDTVKQQEREATAKQLAGEDELLAARAEISKLKKELADALTEAAEYKEQLISVRSELASEQTRCFKLEVDLSQAMRASESLDGELELLRRQKAADEAAAGQGRAPKQTGGVWGWFGGSEES